MEGSGLVPDSQSVAMATFVVSCVCATLGLMVSACFMIFNLYHRRNKVVRMSSPNLNIVTSFGGITLSVVCFLYGLEFIFDGRTYSLSLLCKTRLWLTVLSVTLVFGPVTAKSWRVHEIFKYGLAKKVVIKDGQLFLVLCGLLLVDIILLTLWQTIDPVAVEENWYMQKTLDGDTQNNISEGATSYLLHECTCGKLEVWLGVVALWKLVLVAACLLYGWRIRAVPVPSLNDAAHTFSAVFTAVILTFAASMVATALRGQQNAMYVVTCVGIALCVTCVQTMLFLPKVKHWWTTPENASPRISSASLKTPVDKQTARDGTCDVNGNTYPDDGLVDIVEENKALKVSLLEKEDLISSLQKHLDSAKEKLTKFPGELYPDVATDIVLEGLGVDDIYDTLRVVDSPRDRSKAYKVDVTPRSEHREQATLEQEPLHQTGLKYTPSISASSRHSFVEEFTDIRQSIEDELTNATSVNTELRKSLSRDMDRSFSETEWIYERKEARELAGSIAQSYDLGNNQETIQQLNSYLPHENSVFQVRRMHRTSTASSIVSWQSVENVSTGAVSTGAVEPDNISCDVTSMPRDSATPNSQQHADILRYYSYRHINDGFLRFQNAFKMSKEPGVQDSKASTNTQTNTTVPAVPPRQLKQVITRTDLNLPRDSFV